MPGGRGGYGADFSVSGYRPLCSTPYPRAPISSERAAAPSVGVLDTAVAAVRDLGPDVEAAVVSTLRGAGPATSSEALAADLVDLLGFDLLMAAGALARHPQAALRVLSPSPAATRRPVDAMPGPPSGIVHTARHGYEEIYIPAPPRPSMPVSRLVPVSAVPDWALPALQGLEHFNPVQSAVFRTALYSSENMLVCAPTGAGKTLIALLAMLREVGRHMDAGVVRREEFKLVYVAPMKALAAEVAGEMSKRLRPFGMAVSELTGDIRLSRREVAATQVLVTTPEKWDVVTRRGSEGSPTALVRLLILDEVHLLQDDRGSVIETLVARTRRHVEATQTPMRLLGLSATLPSPEDVARFMGVEPSRGLFCFPGGYRPVPLAQRFIGVDEHGPPRPHGPMNKALWEQVASALADGGQVLVFVHARRLTLATARALKEIAQFEGTREHLLQEGNLTPSLRSEVARLRSAELGELLTFGMAVHHAGLPRVQRSLVERMFRAGAISVLVCTATLAWGVNLPARAVIIRGTEIYDAERGGIVDIGVLDVMQMFGRAGRPQYDATGEGTIITTHEKVQRYVRQLTLQTPIESKFQERLPDHLNAEVVLGTVSSVGEGVRWLGYTYMHCRMQRNPLAYGITHAELASDPLLGGKRWDLLVAAARELDTARMVRFDEGTGTIVATELGRVASHYYLTYQTAALLNERLDSHLSPAEVMKILSACHEFRQVRLRDDEQRELELLEASACPLYRRLPGETVAADTREGKVSTLLQSYITGRHPEAFSLVSDTAFIVDSAGRILRAMFEVCLQRGWSQSAGAALDMANSADKRVWWFQHPLRQLKLLPFDIVEKLEGRLASLSRIDDMEALEVGELIRNRRMGSEVKRAVERFPRVEVSATAQPITRGIMRLTVEVRPLFRWADQLHGSLEPWWLLVEDDNAGMILHHESFPIRKKTVQAGEVVRLGLVVPVPEPIPPQYAIRKLVLPSHHPPYTNLLPLRPLRTAVLGVREADALFPFTHFNPIQTQVFHTCYHTDHNVLLGAPTGSGKTAAAEIAALRVFARYPGQKVVYIGPLRALVRERLEDWRKRFEPLGRRVVELSGETTPDIRVLLAADMICSTPEKWDGVSRSWRTRGYVSSVGLVVIDEVHMLGEERGPTLEAIVSRMRYMGWALNRPLRLVALSTALSNARDLALWLGIGSVGLYNFRPQVRPVPLESHISGFPGKHYCPRMAAMNRPTYQAIMQHSPSKPTLVFVASRRQTRLTAMALISLLASEDRASSWLGDGEEDVGEAAATALDEALRHCLTFGVGIHHAGLCRSDKELVERLFVNRQIMVVVATATLAWGVNFPAHLVVVKGTEFYDGRTRQYVDYPITDVLQMIGRAGRPQFDQEAKAVILVQEGKKAFYRRFLYEPFPVESHLHDRLHSHLNAEVVSGTVARRQDALDWLTWTFLFRRLSQNPSYYGVEAVGAEALTAYLSQLVEGVLRDLEAAGCVEDNGEDASSSLSPTTLGRIASFYYVSHITVAMFRSRLSMSPTHREVLSLLCASDEFSELPVRHNEDTLNAVLSKQVPWELEGELMDSPHTKASLLLQAHMARVAPPIMDYVTDTKAVLDNCARVLPALVDVAADCGLLFGALRAIELTQCITQGVMPGTSALLQLPGVDERSVLSLNSAGICSVAQLLFMSRDEVSAVLSRAIPWDEGVRRACAAVSVLPRIDLHLSITRRSHDAEEEGDEKGEKEDAHEVEGIAGVTLVVDIGRRTPLTRVFAPRCPRPRDEGWWLVVGDESMGELLALRRTPLRRTASVELDLGDIRSGEFMLYLMSDSYVGLDQQYGFRVSSIDQRD